MKKQILIGSGIVAGVLLAGYLGMAGYFTSHYLLNTTIGDLKCGGKDFHYVVDTNTKKAQNYLLLVKDRKGNNYNLIGSDFDYQYVSSGEEVSILKNQNPFSWPLSLWKESKYELKSSAAYDSAALEDIISSMKLFDDDYTEAPHNAYIDISDDDYTVIDEVYGNTPIFENITTEIKEAINNQLDSITLSDECYVKPEICSNSEKLKSTLSQLDLYTNATIHYQIDGVDENLSKKDILKMISISDDGNVTLLEDKVKDFVQQMAYKYNTYGDARNFATSSGDVISVAGGDYGWVINKKKEAEQIIADLSNGVPVEREPIYEQTAKKSGADDIGNTYIEIDYTKQHMWYYKDGQMILESDIVSGNINAANGSVDGIYKIVYKEKDAKLVGENYASDVKYFMPFAYNIGIHDASWRSSFGGEIYKSSGSHGCINAPFETAKALYEMVEVGTPVVAYYREPVVLTNNAAKQSNAFSYQAPPEPSVPAN